MYARTIAATVSGGTGRGTHRSTSTRSGWMALALVVELMNGQ